MSSRRIKINSLPTRRRQRQRRSIRRRQKLVDHLAVRDARLAGIVKFAGASDDEPGFRHVLLADYVNQLPDPYATHGHPQIAWIVASGTIQNGKQPAGSIGGDTLSDLLRQVAKDDQIKALVLRIDSPGGSAFAAEQIRTELDAIKAKGKPVSSLWAVWPPRGLLDGHGSGSYFCRADNSDRLDRGVWLVRQC